MGLMILAEGKVKIFKEGVGGREQIVRMAKPVGFIGFRALFAEENHTATAVAIEDCVSCIVDKESVYRVIRSNAELSMSIIASFASELGFSHDRTVTLTQKHIRGRLAESLIFLKNTYGYEDDGKTIKIYLSREDVPEFNHVVYSAKNENSPFILPKPEVIQERVQKATGCLSPETKRKKEALEKYPLDTLLMRGTLGDFGISWALIEAPDKTIYKVKIGNYLGIYNGKVTAVNNESVNVLELIPDGSGCWIERESVVAIIDSSAKGQRN